MMVNNCSYFLSNSPLTIESVNSIEFYIEHFIQKDIGLGGGTVISLRELVTTVLSSKLNRIFLLILCM